MKDIRKLKIWPLLKEEGFHLWEYRTGGICFGRGALLQPGRLETSPFMEIKPLIDGHWRLTVDFFSHTSSWEKSASDIGRILPEQIENFKQTLNI